MARMPDLDDPDAPQVEEEYTGLSTEEKHAKMREEWIRGFDLVLPLDTGYGNYCGPVEILTRLVKEEGKDVNELDVLGLTPLMKAAARGHTEAVKVLLDLGADIDRKDNVGYTALMKCEDKHPETAAVLVERGAKVEPKPRLKALKYRPGGKTEWVDKEEHEKEERERARIVNAEIDRQNEEDDKKRFAARARGQETAMPR